MRLSEEDRSGLSLRRLPGEVEDLLDRLNSPPRLVAHLTLVHDVAATLVQLVEQLCPDATVDRRAMLFGAATHDIGKTLYPRELDGPGNEHEAAGRQLLVDEGFSPHQARFAETHAAWMDESATIEDLLVAVADKIWKGKRVLELEEKTATALAKLTGQDLWSVLPAL